jgi:transposase InsO family protein
MTPSKPRKQSPPEFKAQAIDLGTRPIAPGIIFHSDCGSQYGSRAHRQILEKSDILQSMSAQCCHLSSEESEN